MSKGGSHGSHLLGNSIWNASSFVVSVALNLLVLPFVLYRLGANAFGIASLVTACTAPALAFSNALALSTTRELAARLAVEDREEAKQMFATALFVGTGAGLAIAAVLGLLAPPLAVRVFHLEGSGVDLTLAFLLGAGGWLCQCHSVVFVALFTARQDFSRVATTGLISVVVATIAIVVLVPLRPTVSTYLGCQALGLAAGLIASCMMSLRLAPGWIAGPTLHRPSLSALFSFGRWQFAAQALAVIATQADRYLLGMFLAPNFVGYYTIAQRLEEAIYIGILKVGEILFPFFTSLRKEASGRIAHLLFRSSWVLNVLGATALGALIPVAGHLLRAWAGSDVASETERLLVVLAAAGILGCASNVFAFYLLAEGRSRASASIAMATSAATVLASAVALPLLGWKAAGWSAGAGMLAQFLMMIWLLRNTFDVDNIGARVTYFVLQPLGTGIVAALVLRSLVTGVLANAPAQLWLVGIAYALSAAVILAVIVAVAAIGPYRRTCLQDLLAIARPGLPRRAT
jgi:O-antigen/teichoic acid export membrane protein